MTNNKGTWIVDGLVSILPTYLESEEYRKQKELEEQQRLEEELFNNLIPSEKEMLMAEIQLNIINLLIESEVI